MAKARIALMERSPFFSTLVLRMGVVWDEPGVGTMATDGVRLFADRAFTASLSDDECLGVLAHEALHVALFHHTRRGGRDPRRWNVAADHAINLGLLADGFTLPAGGLADPRFKDMTAEAIYAALPDDTDSGSAAQTWGAVMDAPTGGEGEAPDMQAADREAQEAVQQAANVARMRGEHSPHVGRALAAMGTTSVDWRDVLHAVGREATAHRTTWARPSRRHINRRVYRPGRVPCGVSRIAVIVDTSGSIDANALARFMGELAEVADVHKPAAVDILHCDTAIRWRGEMHRGDDPPMEINGGGGTDLAPAFDAVRDDPTVRACICFTDLHWRHADVAPLDVPTVWAVWGRSDVPAMPWGTVAPLENGR